MYVNILVARRLFITLIFATIIKWIDYKTNCLFLPLFNLKLNDAIQAKGALGIAGVAVGLQVNIICQPDHFSEELFAPFILLLVFLI